VGLEPTSGVTRHPFSRRAPDPAGWLPFDRQIPGAGIEPATSAFRGRRHYQQQLPRIKSNCASEVPCGSRTRLSGLEDRCLGRSAKGTFTRRSGRRGSRTPKAHRSAAFEAAAITHWLALPCRYHSTGGRNRTCDLLLNREAHGPTRASPVHKSRWPDSNRRSPGPRPGGLARLSHTPKLPSAQRESNPHFRHGKAVGSRYIMGTHAETRVVKEDREHRVGLEPTSPHYGCGVLAAGLPVPTSRWDPRDLNPHQPGKNRVCCR
jgi:hypothetical protein